MQSRRAKRSLLAGAAALALAGAACSGGEEAPGGPAPGTAAQGSAGSDAVAVAHTGDPAKGEEIYGNICSTCHGGNPNEAGTAGPAIAGSSLELVEAKVIRGEYPPGYAPKRGSKAMPPLPYLKDHVPDIAAYLQAAEQG